MSDVSGLSALLTQMGVPCRLNEPMSAHTTFHIGGAAELFAVPETEAGLSAALSACRERGIPYFLLGNGSNLLVSDEGIEGAVFCLGGDFLKTEVIAPDTLLCGGGAKLSAVCRVAAEQSLTGLEFAYGIPGTVGGAVYMNAGAYGREMKDVLVSCRCLMPGGEVCELSAEQLQLGYRQSSLMDSGAIVLQATLRLKAGEREAITAQMEELMRRRVEKQPLEFPSAGSTFKRPAGHYAGALIEEAGLKGFSVGDAQVSPKHAGFVINRGHATCAEIVKLVRQVQETVQKHSGVTLEPEIRRIGRNASWN